MRTPASSGELLSLPSASANGFHLLRREVGFFSDAVVDGGACRQASCTSTNAAISLIVICSPAAKRQATLKVGCFLPASINVMYGRSKSMAPARSSWVKPSSRRRAFSTPEKALINRSFRLGRTPLISSVCYQKTRVY